MANRRRELRMSLIVALVFAAVAVSLLLKPSLHGVVLIVALGLIVLGLLMVAIGIIRRAGRD